MTEIKILLIDYKYSTGDDISGEVELKTNSPIRVNDIKIYVNLHTYTYYTETVERIEEEIVSDYLEESKEEFEYEEEILHDVDKVYRITEKISLLKKIWKKIVNYLIILIENVHLVCIEFLL